MAAAGDSRRSGPQRGLLFWLKAARAPFFTGSLAPILVGTAAAFHEHGTLNWAHALVALLALVLLHAGANLANDYFDHLSGNDEINLSRATPFTGGSRFIQEGLARPAEILGASLISLALGCAAGLYLVWAAGWAILALGVVGAVTGFFYCAPPLKLGYRGLGELAVFLDFGLLPVAGAYYVQAGRFSASAVLLGVIVGLLMANVLWINQFQDAEADAAVGKRHWVVRLGRRRSAMVHAGVFVTVYSLIVLSVPTRLLPPGAFLALLSAPLACWAGAVSLSRYDQLQLLRPANIATILTHFTGSLLLAAGLVFSSIT